jgi:hypothetical protein
VTHWDGVKGIEGKVAKHKHLLQTAPELQIEKVPLFLTHNARLSTLLIIWLAL